MRCHTGCAGNFLFYRKGDVAIRDAATWADLPAALARQRRPLLVDLFGSLTLGEWYSRCSATAAALARHKMPCSPAASPTKPWLSTSSRYSWRVPLALPQPRPARADGILRTRVHARRGGGLYRVFRDAAFRAAGDEQRLPAHYGVSDPNAIAVRRLPTLAKGSEGIGWVDGLAISSKLWSEEGPCTEAHRIRDARRRVYRAVLQPQSMELR